VYANSLLGPFIFDDHIAIVENDSIRAWWQIGRVFAPERELPTAGRPLVNLSFAVNYALGGLHVVGYHVVNVALHVLCGLLLFGLIRRTLELPTMRSRWGQYATRVALFAALLWTVHPLNTEAVNYVTQRTEVMMALFYLLTLYAVCRASPARGGWRWSAIAVVSCAAGMACKETMVTAPIVIVLYDRVFSFRSLRDAWHARWRMYAALASTWVLLGVLVWSGPRIHSAGFATSISPWTYALNQTAMVTRYLWLAVWPAALVSNYGTPAQLTFVDVLPYAMLIAALLGLTVIALRKAPGAGFLAAFAFITLAPTSSLIPIATEAGAERRMYLPLAALVTLIVCAAVRMTDRLAESQFIDHRRTIDRNTMARIGAALCAVAAVGLAARTVMRNREYGSALTLARTTLARYPTSTAHFMVGSELSIGGQHREAEQELRAAIPGPARVGYVLGLDLFEQGRVDEAIDQLSTFVREQPSLLEAVSARQTIGRALVKRQRWAEAAAQFRLVLQMHPSAEQRIDTAGSLADALFRQRAFADAVPWFREYLEAQRDVGALTNLAISLGATDRLAEGLPLFRQAAELDPANVAFTLNLANALADSGHNQEAIAAADRALALQPATAAAYDVMGRALAAEGRLTDAANAFARALQIAPGDADAREGLSRATASRTLRSRDDGADSRRSPARSTAR
jgi:protein O-mannosyl-transferase